MNPSISRITFWGDLKFPGLKTGRMGFKFSGLLLSLVFLFAGCMQSEPETAGVSIGCGNPPAPSACAEGDILAGTDRIAVDACSTAGCGAGWPLSAKVGFGMKFRFQVIREPGLSSILLNPLPLRIVIFSPEGLPPHGEPLDTIEVLAQDAVAEIPAQAFRPAAEAAARMTSSLNSGAVVLNLLLESQLKESGDSSRVHLLQDVAFGFGVRIQNDSIPDRLWSASLGQWPEDTALVMNTPRNRRFSGRLEWEPDTAAVGGDHRLWLGVPGSPYWVEVTNPSESVTIEVPDTQHSLRAVALGNRGLQGVSLTRIWVEGLSIFKSALESSGHF
jgi:hypothetical protein